ncbi:hypothetical protein HPB50_006921 [Hyalomma asiaticum]|uniref:Uncharacterized protein n=1 Tax=Hyalomma asiaticum TaxID=266040 RepID=A0ACB7TG78_HYAAI|nr:hypothetical protein HPB50_006921 [Hyalomma asiaticum]
MWERLRRRVSASHASGRLAALSTATCRLPMRSVLHSCICSVQAFRTGWRPQRGVAPPKRHLLEVALNRRQRGTLAASLASDKNSAPDRRTSWFRCEQRVRHTLSRALSANVVPSTKDAAHCDVAGAEATMFLPKNLSPTGTRRQLDFASASHPARYRTRNFRRPSAFSCCPAGIIDHDAQPPSRRSAQAGPANWASRLQGHCRYLPMLRFEGRRRATHRVYGLHGGPRGFLTGEAGEIEPTYFGNEPVIEIAGDNGGPFFGYLVSNVYKKTADGKTGLVGSPRNTISFAMGSARPRPL